MPLRGASPGPPPALPRLAWPRLCVRRSRLPGSSARVAAPLQPRVARAARGQPWPGAPDGGSSGFEEAGTRPGEPQPRPPGPGPGSGMDVRFYPAAAGDPAGLDFAQCLGYYGYSKFGNNSNYMNMAEANNPFFAASEQTFHTPSLGDEEFEIPPITPPPESDPALSMPDVLPFQGLSDPLPSQGSEFTPQFPPQSLDLPSITISRNLVEQDGVLHSSGLHMDQSHAQVSQYRQDHSLIMRSIVHMTDAARSAIMPPAQLTTINQSQLSAQLGLNLGGASMPHTSPSPPASKSATPSPSSSINEEDADDSNRVSYLP